MPENPEIDNEALGPQLPRPARPRAAARERAGHRGRRAGSGGRLAAGGPHARPQPQHGRRDAGGGPWRRSWRPSACCRRCSTRRRRGRWCARRSGTWRAGRLQPIAELLAEEATPKLGADGGDRRADAAAGLRRGRQRAGGGRAGRRRWREAKEAGLTPAEVAAAFGAVDWGEVVAKGWRGHACGCVCDAKWLGKWASAP